jgi:hypothetical protein
MRIVIPAIVLALINTKGIAQQSLLLAKPDTPVVTINIYPHDTITPVSPLLFGNNANQWMGDMVDQPALIEHIRTLDPGIIRYPGGNGSNTFFWNAAPGHLPADVPDTLLYGEGVRHRKEHFLCGQNPSTRVLSVDRYYQMLSMTHSTGCICVNYGYARYGTGPNPVSAAAHLAADWVRYDHGRTRFWELGNEDFGPWQAGYLIDTTHNRDGQPALASGELYGRQCRVFIDSMKAAARQTGADIRIGVVLVELPPSRGSSPVERNWDEGVLRTAGNSADFLIVHSYYTPYNQNANAAAVLATARPVTDHIMDYMKSLMKDYHLDNKPVALTEYNIFAGGSRQQVSFVNGMHAALVIGEAATRHYEMATRWDLANAYAGGNDHGMFNKGDEPGAPLWNPRPVYYYLYYLRRCLGDHIVRSEVSGDSRDSAITAYASTFHSGEKGLVIVNTGTGARTVRIQVAGESAARHSGHSGATFRYHYYVLTGGDDNGEFSAKVYVNGKGPSTASGGPDDFATLPAKSGISNGMSGFQVMAPARSVLFIVMDPG